MITATSLITSCDNMQIMSFNLLERNEFVVTSVLLCVFVCLHSIITRNNSVYRQLINVYSSSRTKSGCGHFILVLFILLSFGYYQLDCVLKLLSFKCSLPFCIETCGKSLFLISVYRNDDEFGVSLERNFTVNICSSLFVWQHFRLMASI